MINFILIAICIAAGILFRCFKMLPADAHKGINAWIIYLALPAVSFKYLPHIHWDKQLLLPVMMPVIVWLGAWLYVRIYATANKLPKATEGGLKLSAGLSNTSFIGFPLIMTWFRGEGMAVAVICDQVTFIMLSTAGVLVAVNASQKQALSFGFILKKVIQFPPFLGCIGALTIPHFINISILDPLFDKLAVTIGPLALFSIGLQLKFEGWRSEVKNLSIALFYKLILAPALILVIALILGLKGIIPQIAVFEAAMPTLVSSAIVADEYGLNPRLSNLIIGVGILLCFITTSGWWYVLQILR